MITDEAFKATVREIAAERPEYVYQREGGVGTCLYAHADGPGCLISHALHRLGVSLETLSWCEEMPAGEAIQRIAGDDVSPETRAWAHQVQALQDTEHPWGVAVRLADEAVDEAAGEAAEDDEPETPGAGAQEKEADLPTRVASTYARMAQAGSACAQALAYQQGPVCPAER